MRRYGAVPWICRAQDFKETIQGLFQPIILGIESLEFFARGRAVGRVLESLPPGGNGAEFQGIDFKDSFKPILGIESLEFV